MASKADAASPKGIDIGTLGPQQLMQIKKQLDEEVEHLNGSYNQLQGAQAKFNECLRAIEVGVKGKKEDAPILVPLTTSLYVPGKLASTETVIVDIGTGFYVEKSTADADKFYNEKIKELAKSLQELENILQSKSNNLRAVEDVLRQTVLQGQQTSDPNMSKNE